MFSLRKPTEQQIRDYLQERTDKPLSYDVSNGTLLHNNKSDFENDVNFQSYDVEQRRVKLGEGRECFLKAVQAVKEWKTFDVPWVFFNFYFSFYFPSLYFQFLVDFYFFYFFILFFFR